MEVRLVQETDKEFVMSIDLHVNEELFHNRVYTKTGYVMWEGDVPIGLMSYCVLWDNLPFLNFLFMKEEYRNRGYAKQMIVHWEKEMKAKGYQMVLLSTQADESAQHMYRKLGYLDCGGLLFQNTPMDQPMEVFFRKVL